MHRTWEWNAMSADVIPGNGIGRAWHPVVPFGKTPIGLMEPDYGHARGVVQRKCDSSHRGEIRLKDIVQGGCGKDHRVRTSSK